MGKIIFAALLLALLVAGCVQPQPPTPAPGPQPGGPKQVVTPSII